MAKLDNPKHEHFAKCVAKGLSLSEAYDKAYENGLDNRSRASKLASKDNIKARIAEIRTRTADRVDIDIDNVLNFAIEVRERAINLDKPDFTNALKANDQACRIIGAYQDKLEIGTKPKTIEELVKASKGK